LSRDGGVRGQDNHGKRAAPARWKEAVMHELMDLDWELPEEVIVDVEVSDDEDDEIEVELEDIEVAFLPVPSAPPRP
jgi:hypothetical protein